MSVKQEDGCRSCGGPLQILDANRYGTVTCVECADTYNVDEDAFDDGPISDTLSMPVPKRKRGGAT